MNTKTTPLEESVPTETAEHALKKPYTPPCIEFLEEMEVIAGLCAKADNTYCSGLTLQS